VPEGTLILVPTELERRELFGGEVPAQVCVRLCGFGLAEAGARAAHAIATCGPRPARIVLVGIAGSYDAARWPPGSAVVGGSVRLYGIGAGGQTPSVLGFAQTDLLPLDGGGPEILSVAEASADRAQAAVRQARFPAAAVEEMEGFAVAVAAAAFGVPLRVIRGVSNLAGDRDRDRWQIPEALRAAAAALQAMP
jgi:futalosine hydrolase